MTEHRDDFSARMEEAFRRIDPPAGLEQRILARAETRSLRRRWIGIAASVIVLASVTVGGLNWREKKIHEEQARIARQQFMIAADIIARQAAKADRRLTEIGVETIQVREISK